MFDEQYVTDFISGAIKKAFGTKEWRTAFGGKALKIVEDSFGETTTFPVVYVEITDAYRANGTYDSSQKENYTTFFFTIAHYNQAVEKTGESKKELGIRINKKIVEVLQEEMNPHITRNARVESPDETIYRREIEGYCNIANHTKTFYR